MHQGSLSQQQELGSSKSSAEQGKCESSEAVKINPIFVVAADSARESDAGICTP